MHTVWYVNCIHLQMKRKTENYYNNTDFIGDICYMLT